MVHGGVSTSSTRRDYQSWCMVECRLAVLGEITSHGTSSAERLSGVMKRVTARRAYREAVHSCGRSPGNCSQS
jgi:hypothetical protein